MHPAHKPKPKFSFCVGSTTQPSHTQLSAAAAGSLLLLLLLARQLPCSRCCFYQTPAALQLLHVCKHVLLVKLPSGLPQLLPSTRGADAAEVPLRLLPSTRDAAAAPLSQQHVDVEGVEQLLCLNLDGVLTPPLTLKQAQQHILHPTACRQQRRESRTPAAGSNDATVSVGAPSVEAQPQQALSASSTHAHTLKNKCSG